MRKSQARSFICFSHIYSNNEFSCPWIFPSADAFLKMRSGAYIQYSPLFFIAAWLPLPQPFTKYRRLLNQTNRLLYSSCSLVRSQPNRLNLLLHLKVSPRKFAYNNQTQKLIKKKNVSRCRWSEGHCRRIYQARRDDVPSPSVTRPRRRHVRRRATAAEAS